MNCNVISSVIWTRIQNGTYKPELAGMFDIPKKDGGTRPLTSFSIPDSVIAKLVYRSIAKRFRRRCSLKFDNGTGAANAKSPSRYARY